MTEEANKRLRQFPNEGRNWERKATNIPGVFLFRLPASKGRSASLAIEINPVDTYGSITKKRGVVIRSASELDEISRLLVIRKLVIIRRVKINCTEDGLFCESGSA